MAPGTGGVGGGKPGEIIDPSRGGKGEFGGTGEGAPIVRDMAIPGAEVIGGEGTTGRVTEGVERRSEEWDAMAEQTRVEAKDARRAEAEAGRDVPGTADAYVGNTPPRVPPSSEIANWGTRVTLFFRQLASVGEVSARRARESDVGDVPNVLVQKASGEVEIAELGRAEFVDMATVKQEIDKIENDVSWSESHNQAVRRKTSQLEPALVQQHKGEYKKTFEERDKAALDKATVKEKYLKQGKSDTEAETLANKEIAKRKAEIDKEAEKRAKPVAKAEAHEKAVDWYKDASLRRRQAIDARAEVLLPEMQKKYPKNPDMAKYQAERQAKKEWDNRIKEAKEDLAVVLDTNFPGVSYNYLRVIDHHGAFLIRADGSMQKQNATMQVLNRFEDALRAAGTKDLNNPTDAQVQKAMELLNIKQVTTDNLADGMWSVWIARNQAAVLKNPRIRSLIREATYFEDFSAFSQGRYDRKAEAVEYQAALFFGFGQILKSNGVFGSDRVPPEKAKAVVEETMKMMDQMIYDYPSRSTAADAFWKNVDLAREKAKAKGAVIHEATVDGNVVMKFYDMKQLSEFTVFEQWLAVPDIYRGSAGELPIQVTVAPAFVPKLKADGTPELKADGKPVMVEDPSQKLFIVASPYGNKLAAKEGLLKVLDALNKAEKAKADELGVPANFWFGKDVVVLPNPAGGGSRLSAKEVSDIVTDAKYGLFDTKGAGKGAEAPLDGTGDRLTTVGGQEIAPLNPHHVVDVTGFGAQRAYRDASKVIDEYGVGRTWAPRAKGERLKELAERGDPRAKEALDLLSEMKGGGGELVLLSENKSGQDYIDVRAKDLQAKAARVKTLVAELGPALEGKSTVPADQRAKLITDAKAEGGKYDGHQKNAQDPTQGTQVAEYTFAEAWKQQGTEAQRQAADQVLEAAEANKKIVHEIEVLENGLKDANFKDSAEGKRAEKVVDDLYGVLDRNMKVIERWKNYKAERDAFDVQIGNFELPFIADIAMGNASIVGSTSGILDVSTRSPELYEDIGGVGKTAGDYAVTIWVDSRANQGEILGEIWSQHFKQNPNGIKRMRDAHGFYYRIYAEGRQFDVHVEVARPDAKIEQAVPLSSTGTYGAGVVYDAAAKRSGSPTDVTQ